eukprot:gene14435-21035_t
MEDVIFGLPVHKAFVVICDKAQLEWSATLGGSCFTCGGMCVDEPTDSCTKSACGCAEGWHRQTWQGGGGECYTCDKTCLKEPTDGCTSSHCMCPAHWTKKSWSGEGGGACHTCEADGAAERQRARAATRAPPRRAAQRRGGGG